MGQTRHFKTSDQAINNSGFSPNSNAEGGRLINKDGSYNLRKSGIPLLERLSIYHTMLGLSNFAFIMSVFGIYAVLNILFASIYVFLGPDSLYDLGSNQSMIGRYLTAFFFSSQTLTTVGYGHISPAGLPANIVASIESFIGIMSFALVTGLFFARFSRPKAYIRFSDNMLVAPYKGGRAIMFRLATYKNNQLANAETQVTAALHVLVNGKTETQFYPLQLEFSKINSLAISWTVVHPITEDSPFWNFTEQDFKQRRIELMISMWAFDDHFSNTVQQRTSYTKDELVFGARFLPMYNRSEDGKFTRVLLDKLSAYELTTF